MMSDSTKIYVLSGLYSDNIKNTYFTSVLNVSLNHESYLKRMNEEINNRDPQLQYFFPLVGFNISTWVNDEEVNTQSYSKEGVINEKN